MEWKQLASRPLCAEGAVVQGEKYRITVLTSRLFRLEYSEDGVFEDRPTQCVLNRDFPVPAYQVFETDTSLKIVTEGVELLYDKQKFSPSGLSLTVKARGCAHNGVWHYGEEVHDLGGTARTLDGADGAVELEHGLLSNWGGYSLLDDSRSLLIRPDGWVEPRQGERTDLYFFGYGHAYQECLRDFYHLTGPAPLLPRYALGNWWSRFHRYDEAEYKALMERFEAEQVPFSVAVIDMDWHLVDVDPKYGSGWTGYTWNRELFPDPAEFMGWLHRHGLRVTLNVHPADGVRPFEEAYRPMAEALGKDWQKEETVEFDITDPQFLQAYFKYLHHPNEEAGVDFWWVDWQQGTRTKIPGLDPPAMPASAATGIRWDSRETPSSPGNLWPSSPISRPTPATRAMAGGATTSADICRATGTTSCPPAGCSSACSRPSCGCTARAAPLPEKSPGTITPSPKR